MRFSPALLVLLVFHALRLTAADSWQSIVCPPADPLPEEMFDVVRKVDDFEAAPLRWQPHHFGQNANVTLARDTAEHHAGAAAMRGDYEFTGRKDLEYIEFSTKFDIPEPGYGFGFWAKTDGTPFAFRLRVADRSGETHQFDMMAASRPGWQYIAVSLGGPSGAWGGDGNHKLDYPCRLEGILIDRPAAGFVGRGSFWIDDVSLLRRHKPAPSTLKVEVNPKHFGNLYAVGEAVSLRARGEGREIKWHAVYYAGKEVAQGQGEAGGTEIQFTPKSAGYFALTIELQGQGGAAEKQVFALAALPGGSESVRSDFLGMCTHFGHHTYPLECMELLRHYGIDQFRDEISWGAFEPQRGKYKMPEHAAAYLEHAVEVGMRPLLIFDYAHSQYDGGGFPHSPEALAGFAAYSAELARQTRGTVNQFEVWNEWVGGCGMDGRPGAHDGDAYGRLLRPTYAAVKKARPDAVVVGIGGEYGPKCAETIVAAIHSGGAASMDAWSIHPYRYPRGAEQSDLTGEVNRIAARVAEAGAKQKAWITEIGWPTHRLTNGTDEHAQAYHAVRALAMIQSTGVVEKVFWYDFKDDGLNRDYNEDNFGVVRHQSFNCAPKPAAVSLAVFVRLSQDAKCGPLWHSGSAYAMPYLLTDGRVRLMAWALKPGTAVEVSGHVAEAVDLMGNPLDHAGPWLLGPEPIYLTGKDLRLGR